MFFPVYIFLLRKVVDGTLPNSLKGNTQPRGKEETKKKDPGLGQKSKTQSRSLRDKGTNHVPKLSLVPRSISDKKRDKKLGKTRSLEKFSLALSHLKKKR
jgi:hypothetical protein